MSNKGKSTNGLMKHIRENHEINISGSKQKQELLNIGYYHGYKAYRFVGDTTNQQPFSDFSEIKAVYEFDHELKAMLYPILMKIETSLKNRTIDILVPGQDSNIEYIYDNYLNAYKDYTRENDVKKYRDRVVEFKEKMISTVVYNYKNSTVIKHFLNKGEPIPLWAYFEVTTLGEYGQFIECLNKQYRIKLLRALNLYHSGMDPEAKNLKTIIFLMNDLRNAVMHNSVIYDCRFKKSNSNNSTNQQIYEITKITAIDFNNITDYFILLTVLQSAINTSKTELRKQRKSFIEAKDRLYDKIPNSAFNSIFNTNTNNKLIKLETFIDNIV